MEECGCFVDVMWSNVDVMWNIVEECAEMWMLCGPSTYSQCIACYRSHRSFSSIFIYSDIADFTFVGYIVAPILELCHLIL